MKVTRYHKMLHRVGRSSAALIIPHWWVDANGKFVTITVDKNKITVRPRRGAKP